MEINDGVHPGMSRADYAAIAAVNFSSLKHMARSPAHCRYAMDHPTPATPAMQLGTAVHMAVLEYDRFLASYAVAPVCDRRTKAGKALWAEHVEVSRGKTLLSTEDFERCCWIRESLANHRTASELLNGPVGWREVSVVWTDEKTGLRCKGLIDLLTIGRDNDVIVVDLKTTQDASEWAFGASVARLYYHVQAAWYLHGLGMAASEAYRRWVWIAVESDQPHCAVVWELEAAGREAGQRLWRDWLDQYAECLRTGSWPGYGEGIRTIGMPKWSVTS